MGGSRGGGDRGSEPPPPENYQEYRISLPYWSGSTVIPQSYMHQASIRCWATIGPSAKRHLDGVSLAGR